MSSTLPPHVVEAHRRAVEAGQTHYIDPATGYRVFTELGLKQRGDCCGNRCRHCPYEHRNVPGVQRSW